MPNLFTQDLKTLTIEDVESFVESAPPGSELVRENTRLDYKLDVPDDLGQLVGAFANTYGGLIFIGVAEKQGAPVSIPGTAKAKGDLKTALTNIIETTVYPCPRFEIAVVDARIADRLVAVIRVQQGTWPPYMFTKGGENRLLVRRSDKRAPAAPLELEQLFSRRRNEHTDVTDIFGLHDFNPRTLDLKRNELKHYVKIWVRPLDESINIVVDTAAERTVMEPFEANLVDSKQPHALQVTRRGPGTFDAESNYAYDSGEVRHQCLRFVGGDIGFASQTLLPGPSPRICVPEVASFIVRTLQVSRWILGQFGYRGRVRISAEVGFGSEKLDLQDPSGWAWLDGIGADDMMCDDEIGAARFSQVADCSELDAPAGFVARTLLDVLREQRGRVVDYDKLRKSIERRYESSKPILYES